MISLPLGKRCVAWAPHCKSESNVAQNLVKTCHFVPLFTPSFERLLKPQILAQQSIAIADGTFGTAWHRNTVVPLFRPPLRQETPIAAERKRPLRVTSTKSSAENGARHFSCSRAPKKSADIKAAKSMACV